jgi:tetratricopeptide (TPR) repeat protein
MIHSRPTLVPFLAGACLMAGTALAPAPLAAQEVVQALPNPASAELSNALQRLSRNPNSVPALVDAGRASLALDNLDAAQGFFSRALAISPEDGRVLAGLALVALRGGDAVTALHFFDNADAAGEPMAPLAADHGLAYDLVGNNAGAQRL